MSRHRMSLRTRAVEQVTRSARPEAGLGAHAFRTATDHPFEPGAHAPACAEADPELFWPATEAQAEQARAVCRTCPLREACLAVAVRRGEWGVWGGELR